MGMKTAALSLTPAVEIYSWQEPRDLPQSSVLEDVADRPLRRARARFGRPPVRRVRQVWQKSLASVSKNRSIYETLYEKAQNLLMTRYPVAVE
ncbi:hypothetical protein [Methylorubrum extorquens]|uniref:hypothetical protein n=1 Tax=Methylorubrum extorquens TaxID=408 RepID=UPI001EE59B01|nr:hypothetical protein [Methylorubrum extorquens]MCG5248410.1 hypothetical protein [Methylorubrum extorquens]